MKVVVVGAGLGGLCAANGLRAAGADVEVIEARDAIGDVGQGYRINVNETGHAALRACLDADRFGAYERALHRQGDPAVYLFSPALRELSRYEVPPPPGAIDRGTLRRLLAGGVADRIRFGRPVASLADVDGADLVVAADGVGSVLRRQLLPGADPRPMGWSAIFGRAPLTGDSRRWTAPAVLHSRFCGIVDGTTVLALGAYDPPGATAPYVMWVLMGPADDLPARGTAPADLLRFARQRTAGWDARAVAALTGAVPDDTFLTPLHAMAGIPDIPARAGVPVAFLGDAVHAMSPAAGEGANTALADAALLVSHLLTDRPIADAVSDYHAEMRVSAGAALRRSAAYSPTAYPTQEATRG